VGSPLRPVAALAAVTMLAAACANNADDADTGTTTTTTATPGAQELDIALADVRERLESHPEAIAEDMSALSLTQVTADQVRSVARTLCESGFSPDVTMSWLQGLMLTNVAMVGPANRLLRYSGAPEICGRGPTSDERDFYRSEVYQALASTPPLPPGATQVPDEVEAVVCDILGAPGSGDVTGATLNGLLDLAARGGFDAGEFLPFVVEVAGAGCDQWLPTAIEALDRYLSP
jgi:hypothetical protein